MRFKNFSHLLLISFTVSGCGSEQGSISSEKEAIAQVSAPYSQGAIRIIIQSDPDLNSLNGIANSCTLLIIQSEKANTLNKLLSNPVAIKKLFNGAGAQEDILKVDRYYAMPGQKSTLHIDRSDNSRFFAVIAGYYPFPQKQHMALISIPVITERSGWWNPRWYASLGDTTLMIRLGESGITHTIENSQNTADFEEMTYKIKEKESSNVS
ncbi:type VI secretion system lipoprotein TssJ [Salmonella enterica subsp. enterica]|nr:type VI secretion system lipoprotein TssJ [Salmonella enterica subsp. enterica serovar Typhimurium]EHP3225508.1 type VI secretion lipoprotein TssJ [Salmonella enterica subsp. enterica serovar Newport]